MNANASFNTSGSTGSCYFLFVTFDHVKYIKWTFIFSSTVNALLAIPATLGNAVVLMTILKNPSLHTPSNCLLFSLAVSDLGVGLIVQPLCALYKISEMEEKFLPYCIAGLGSEILAFTFTATAFMTIAAISFDRYLAIRLHLRYQELVPVSRVIKVVMLLWVFGLVMSVGRLFCFGNCQSLVTAFATVFSFFLLATVISYIKIGQTVRKLVIQVNPDETGDPLHNRIITCVQMSQMKKSVVTMLYVVGTYVLCFVLYMTALAVCVLLEWDPFSRGVLNVVFPIAFLNSSLNPLIYCWRIRIIRHFAKRTVFKMVGIHKSSSLSVVEL
ncbi:5-hydroxytryptamine receptor 1B-like [Actinia tenebrosa]|uniref:5-hydroxytryptamine receptor 1B-like n=1 Tax=Actinia tenebrosa TaxID=6105 RepID=A0A6P8ILS7_ACTTE|nr:5-hydroxytryptamine receptor 1B-like [Actinia tenebrosa]